MKKYEDAHRKVSAVNRQLRAKSGPHYERWLAAMSKFIEREKTRLAWQKPAMSRDARSRYRNNIKKVLKSAKPR